MAPVFMNRLYRSFTATLLDNLGRILDIADSLVRLIGPFLILFAALLIFGCTASYFRHFLPYLIHYQNDGEFTWSLFFTSLIGVFILGNIVYNYYRCIFTDPGYTTDLRYKQIVDLFDPASAALPPQAPHEVNYCRICNVPKPRRVHHCSVCDRCVVKMDHHCPWVNNCIGVRTYPYFLRVLFWVCSGCLFISINGYSKFMQQWNVCDSNWITTHQGEYQSLSMQELVRKAKENSSSSLTIRFLAWISPLGPSNGGTIGRRLLETTVGTVSSSTPFFSWATYNKYMDINLWMNSVYVFVIKDWFGIRPLSSYFYTSWWNDGLFGCNRLLTVSYAVCVCVGIAIGILFTFHLYLTLTAQTSIEFYRNRQEKYKFEQKQNKKKILMNANIGNFHSLKGRVWKNRYDAGGWRKNWYNVFGTYSVVGWVLPPSWIGIRGITAAKKKARDVEEIYSKLSSSFAPEFNGSSSSHGNHGNSTTVAGATVSSSSSTAIAIRTDSDDDDNSFDDEAYDIPTGGGRGSGGGYPTSNRRHPLTTTTAGGGWVDHESTVTSENDEDDEDDGSLLTETDEEYGNYGTQRTVENTG